LRRASAHRQPRPWALGFKRDDLRVSKNIDLTNPHDMGPSDHAEQGPEKAGAAGHLSAENAHLAEADTREVVRQLGGAFKSPIYQHWKHWAREFVSY
jgi:hypothetical protein